jgi:hypothetical protein
MMGPVNSISLIPSGKEENGYEKKIVCAAVSAAADGLHPL